MLLQSRARTRIAATGLFLAAAAAVSIPYLRPVSARAEENHSRKIFAVSGPISLGRGQHLRTSLLLPAVQKSKEPLGRFKLYFRDLKGNAIDSKEFTITGGGEGCRIDLIALGDGSVRIVECDGSVRTTRLAIGEGDTIELTGILIGLLRTDLLPAVQLPAVQRPVATLQLGANREGHPVGPTSAILPYVEQ